MSRTYKYPRDAFDKTIIRMDQGIESRIRKRLETQKRARKKRTKMDRDFRKLISYRDKQRAKV